MQLLYSVFAMARGSLDDSRLYGWNDAEQMASLDTCDDNRKVDFFTLPGACDGDLDAPTAVSHAKTVIGGVIASLLVSFALSKQENVAADFVQPPEVQKMAKH